MAENARLPVPSAGQHTVSVGLLRAKLIATRAKMEDWEHKYEKAREELLAAQATFVEKNHAYLRATNELIAHPNSSEISQRVQNAKDAVVDALKILDQAMDKKKEAGDALEGSANMIAVIEKVLEENGKNLPMTFSEHRRLGQSRPAGRRSNNTIG
jgi:hypothetical protein